VPFQVTLLIDMTPATTEKIIRTYSKVDAENYRLETVSYYPEDFVGPVVVIKSPYTWQDWKVTIQSVVAEGGLISPPFSALTRLFTTMDSATDESED
jgi:hypothetical protein